MPCKPRWRGGRSSRLELLDRVRRRGNRGFRESGSIRRRFRHRCIRSSSMRTRGMRRDGCRCALRDSFLAPKRSSAAPFSRFAAGLPFPHIPRNTTQAVVVVIACGDQNTKSSLFPVSLRRFDRALSPNQTQTSEPPGWLLALFRLPSSEERVAPSMSATGPVASPEPKFFGDWDVCSVSSGKGRRLRARRPRLSESELLSLSFPP